MTPNPAPPSRLSVGSLCTGYGGLDMGLALGLGHNLRHAWHVENDGEITKGKRKGQITGPRAILAARYPGVPNYGDLKTLDYSQMEPVDWLTAGYPCQPFSDAGKRLGEADERHLWPYVAATIGALRPRNVLLENVRGHVRRGLPSVLADLAALGYNTRWGLVRASDADAPHLRARVFIAATDASDERHERARGARIGWDGPADERVAAAHSASDGRHEGRAEPAGQLGRPDVAKRGSQASADTMRDGRPWGEERHVGALQSGLEAPRRADVDGRVLDWGVYDTAIRRWEAVLDRAAPWATEPRGRGGVERLSPRFVEWMMGLPAGWVTDVPDLTANEQLKALGNGVVPQQAALAVRLLLGGATSCEVAA